MVFEGLLVNANCLFKTRWQKIVDDLKHVLKRVNSFVNLKSEKNKNICAIKCNPSIKILMISLSENHKLILYTLHHALLYEHTFPT